MIRIPLVLFAGFALLLTVALLVGQRNASVDISEPPADIRLGAPLPHNLTCEYWYNEYPQSVYCNRDGYSVQYDVGTRQITYVSHYVYDSGLAAGDLIDNWGPPQAYKSWYHINVLIWADRYAYVIGHEFTPNSRVVALVWSEKRDGTAWQGFINAADR